MLVKDNKNMKVMLLVNQVKERHSIDLKDTAKFGFGLRNFKLFINDRNVYIVYASDQSLKTSISIIILEMYEAGAKNLVEKTVEFDYEQLEFSSDERFIYLAFKSSTDSQILCWRIDNKSGSVARVPTISQVPGETVVTSRTIYGLLTSEGTQLLYIQHPGKRYFSIQGLDFQTQTVTGISKFYSGTKSPIYFMSLNNCLNPSDSCLQGVMGGKTDFFQEFRIPIDYKEKTLGEIKFVFEYIRLATERFKVDRVVNHGGLYMLIGDFGEMETSEETINSNKQIEVATITKFDGKITTRLIQEKANSKRVLEDKNSEKSVERVAALKNKEKLERDAGKMELVRHLIYRKGETEPLLKHAFMRGYGDTDYAKFETLGKSVLYVTKRENSLKYYKIDDFSLKELILDNKGAVLDANEKGITKPIGPVNLAIYAQRYIETKRVYPNQGDIYKSKLQLYFGLLFVACILLLCFLGYKFSG